jgi:hypothetical protein
MKAKYGLFLILMSALMITLSALPCRAQGTSEEKKAEEKKGDIWTEEEPPGPGGRGGPPGRGGPRRGPRFDLTDEEIGRILKSIKESNPEKAKELEKMRKEDPNNFQEQLREYGGDEFGKIIRERIDKWREQRREEFLKWLEENFRRQAEELKRLQDPDLYWKKYEIIRQKFWRIFEEERRNPELAEALKEKIRVEYWRDRLLREIRREKDEKRKKELINKLREAVGRRFDLIVREKQIAYKWLSDRLEELRRRVEESQAEIKKLKDPKVKKQNIDERVDCLLKDGC